MTRREPRLAKRVCGCSCEHAVRFFGLFRLSTRLRPDLARRLPENGIPRRNLPPAAAATAAVAALLFRPFRSGRTYVTCSGARSYALSYRAVMFFLFLFSLTTCISRRNLTAFTDGKSETQPSALALSRNTLGSFGKKIHGFIITDSRYIVGERQGQYKHCTETRTDGGLQCPMHRNTLHDTHTHTRKYPVCTLAAVPIRPNELVTETLERKRWSRLRAIHPSSSRVRRTRGISHGNRQEVHAIAMLEFADRGEQSHERNNGFASARARSCDLSVSLSFTLASG